MRIKAKARSYIDKSFPFISKIYRKARDNLRHARQLRKAYMTGYGFRLFGDPNLDITRQTSHEIDVFLERLNSADLVIDVGANVGLFSCLAALNGKDVIAIEPHPDNLRLLYKNISCNNFDVEVLPIAVSNFVGLVSLFGGGQGASLLPGWGNMHNTYSQLVPVNSLDNLLATRIKNRSILIKIDVEGNEYYALQGAKKILEENKEIAWIIEHGMYENFNGELNPHFQELFEMFWSHGYQCFTIDREQKLVSRSDVEGWIRHKKRMFGDIYYYFTNRV